MNKQFLSYVSGNSFLHQLDPRTKIITLMILSIIIFNISRMWSLLFVLLLLVVVASIARVSVKKLALSARPLLPFIVIIFLLHFIFSPAIVFSDVPLSILDNGVAYQINITSDISFLINPSLYSFITGFGVALKFFLLILFASLMAATTRQSALIQGIERLVRPLPLKWVNLTSHDLALMIFLTIRFIPLLITTAAQIRVSAVSRAFRPARHPLRTIKILSTTMVNSILHFTDDVSRAMLSRGYTGVGKTSMNELKFRKRDGIFFCSFAAVMFSIIVAVDRLQLLIGSGI